MYRAYYSDVTSDDQASARRAECAALSVVIDRLQAAKTSPGDRHLLTGALDALEALWGIFLKDLANPDNALPVELRAGLVSIGRWIFMRASEIREGGAADLDALIDINTSILRGLQAQA